jgi:hypothetical protein
LNDGVDGVGSLNKEGGATNVSKDEGGSVNGEGGAVSLGGGDNRVLFGSKSALCPDEGKGVPHEVQKLKSSFTNC